MPFPRTWSEELIAEWLQLKGYFVETGVPLRSGSMGGRFEADVIGIKGKDDTLEIFHIEIGSLPGGAKASADTIKGKFSKENVEAVTGYCKRKLGFPLSTQTAYNKLFVVVWGSDTTMSYLEQNRLPAKYLWDLIENEIRPAIQQWKKDPPHRPQTRGKIITLPENMWLLDLLDYISE